MWNLDSFGGKIRGIWAVFGEEAQDLGTGRQASLGKAGASLLKIRVS